MTAQDQVTEEGRIRDRMAVEIASSVDQGPVHREEFILFEILFKTGVVISGSEPELGLSPDLSQDLGHLGPFLVGDIRDHMLEIAEHDQVVGIGLFDDGKQPRQTRIGRTLKVQTMPVKVGLDAEVRVGDHQRTLLPLDEDRGPVCIKFRLHDQAILMNSVVGV